MESTYDKSAQRALDELASLQDETLANNNSNSSSDTTSTKRRLWIGLAGAPGSGKTTVGEAVVKRINDQRDEPLAICLPMDGYHFSQQQMKDFQYNMKRRGAPWTFDAESMCRDLIQAKQQAQGEVVRFPGYSRDISDPVPNQILLQPHHQIVIVEGLYVLLGCLAAASSSAELQHTLESIETETDWGAHKGTSIQDEMIRWKPLWDAVWDDTWFVAPPAGLDENKRRLVGRSLKTWSAEKTALWGEGENSSDREAAERRVEFNDMKNARLIALCQPFAKVPIDSI